MKLLAMKQMIDYAYAQFGDIPVRVGSREESVPVTGVWVPETVDGVRVLVMSSGGKEVPHAGGQAE